MNKASVPFIYALTIWVVEMVADTPVGVGTIGGSSYYRTAANGIVAYLPASSSRYHPSRPWALQRVHQNAPKVVSAYLPNQYATPESKPWALPSRSAADTPNVVAAYLPAQYSSAPSLPWRLPLQTSGARLYSANRR